MVVLRARPTEAERLRYRQTVGAPAGGDPGAVNWDGSELVAFKLHLPSRIHDHNVKRLDGTNGTTERGNILTWEQTLADRRAGKPIDMDVTMDATSILYTTLWLFAGAFAGAVAVLCLIVWWTMRRGRRSRQCHGQKADARPRRTKLERHRDCPIIDCRPRLPIIDCDCRSSMSLPLQIADYRLSMSLSHPNVLRLLLAFRKRHGYRRGRELAEEVGLNHSPGSTSVTAVRR